MVLGSIQTAAAVCEPWPPVQNGMQIACSSLEKEGHGCRQGSPREQKVPCVDCRYVSTQVQNPRFRNTRLSVTFAPQQRPETKHLTRLAAFHLQEPSAGSATDTTGGMRQCLHGQTRGHAVGHHARAAAHAAAAGGRGLGLPLLNHDRLRREHDARNTARIDEPAARHLRCARGNLDPTSL